jgi:hypothetical protein
MFVSPFPVLRVLFLAVFASKRTDGAWPKIVTAILKEIENSFK